MNTAPISAPLLTTTATQSAKGNALVSYHKKTRPVFQPHCHGCHQPTRVNSGNVMADFVRLFFKGIVTEDPDKICKIITKPVEQQKPVEKKALAEHQKQGGEVLLGTDFPISGINALIYWPNDVVVAAGIEYMRERLRQSIMDQGVNSSSRSASS